MGRGFSATTDTPRVARRVLGAGRHLLTHDIQYPIHRDGPEQHAPDRRSPSPSGNRSNTPPKISGTSGRRMCGLHGGRAIHFHGRRRAIPTDGHAGSPTISREAGVGRGFSATTDTPRVARRRLALVGTSYPDIKIPRLGMVTDSTTTPAAVHRSPSGSNAERRTDRDDLRERPTVRPSTVDTPLHVSRPTASDR